MNDSNPIDDPQLAEFQAELLELLARSNAPADAMDALKAMKTTQELADYVAGFEPRMVEVAAVLVKKWGVRAN